MLTWRTIHHAQVSPLAPFWPVEVKQAAVASNGRAIKRTNNLSTTGIEIRGEMQGMELMNFVARALESA